MLFRSYTHVDSTGATKYDPIYEDVDGNKFYFEGEGDAAALRLVPGGSSEKNNILVGNNGQVFLQSAGRIYDYQLLLKNKIRELESSGTWVENTDFNGVQEGKDKTDRAIEAALAAIEAATTLADLEAVKTTYADVFDDGADNAATAAYAAKEAELKALAAIEAATTLAELEAVAATYADLITGKVTDPGIEGGTVVVDTSTVNAAVVAAYEAKKAELAPSEPEPTTPAEAAGSEMLTTFALSSDEGTSAVAEGENEGAGFEAPAESEPSDEEKEPELELGDHQSMVRTDEDGTYLFEDLPAYVLVDSSAENPELPEPGQVYQPEAEWAEHKHIYENADPFLAGYAVKVISDGKHLVSKFHAASSDGVVDSDLREFNADMSGDFNADRADFENYAVVAEPKITALSTNDEYEVSYRGYTYDLANRLDRKRAGNAGLVLRDPVRIGGLVWNDTNKDGLQASGEEGVPGAVIKLTRYWYDTTGVGSLEDGKAEEPNDQETSETPGTSEKPEAPGTPADSDKGESGDEDGASDEDAGDDQQGIKTLSEDTAESGGTTNTGGTTEPGTTEPGGEPGKQFPQEILDLAGKPDEMITWLAAESRTVDELLAFKRCHYDFLYGYTTEDGEVVAGDARVRSTLDAAIENAAVEGRYGENEQNRWRRDMSFSIDDAMVLVGDAGNSLDDYDFLDRFEVANMVPADQIVYEEHNGQQYPTFPGAAYAVSNGGGLWEFMVAGTGSHDVKVDATTTVRVKALFGYRVEVVSYPEEYELTTQHVEGDLVNSDYNEETGVLVPNNADLTSGKIKNIKLDNTPASFEDLIVLSRLAESTESSSTAGPLGTYAGVNNPQQPDDPAEDPNAPEGGTGTETKAPENAPAMGDGGQPGSESDAKTASGLDVLALALDSLVQVMAEEGADGEESPDPDDGLTAEQRALAAIAAFRTAQAAKNIEVLAEAVDAHDAALKENVLVAVPGGDGAQKTPKEVCLGILKEFIDDATTTAQLDEIRDSFPTMLAEILQGDVSLESYLANRRTKVEIIEKINETLDVDALEKLGDEYEEVIFGKRVSVGAGDITIGDKPVYDGSGDPDIRQIYTDRLTLLEALIGSQNWSDMNWIDSMNHDLGLYKEEDPEHPTPTPETPVEPIEPVDPVEPVEPTLPGPGDPDYEDGWLTLVFETPWGTQIFRVKLPQTGDELMPWALGLAAAAALGLALAVVARRREEDEEEEVEEDLSE